MYAQLKQIMKEHGYKPTAGEGWTGIDSREFDTFIHFVLGAPLGMANRLLAYPTAHPQIMGRLQKLLEGSSPVAAPVAAPVEEFEGPDEGVPVAAAAPVQEQAPQDTFDLTPQGQVEKQEIEQPVIETPPESTSEVGDEVGNEVGDEVGKEVDADAEEIKEQE